MTRLDAARRGFKGVFVMLYTSRSFPHIAGLGLAAMRILGVEF